MYTYIGYAQHNARKYSWPPLDLQITSHVLYNTESNQEKFGKDNKFRNSRCSQYFKLYVNLAHKGLCYTETRVFGTFFSNEATNTITALTI